MSLTTISRASTDNLDVSIATDKTNVPLNDYLTLEVTISGDDSGSIENPEIKGIEDFNVLGISTGTQISIVNMSMHKAKTFTYTLQPKTAEKRARIQASIEYEGKNTSSNVIEVMITKATKQPPSRNGRRAPNMFDNFFGRREPFGSFGSRNIRKDDFILQAHVDNSEVYVGQEIVYKLNFYRAYNIWSDAQYNFPNANGFWVELLPDANKMTSREITIAERNYIINEMSLLLYPLTDGEKIIEPGTIKFQPNAFSPAIQLESNKVKIKVLPLPDSGKPKDFSGLVGEFEISVALEGATTSPERETGKPVTVNVSVSGNGNLHAIQKPSFSEIENVEMYEPEILEDFNRTSSGSQGLKTFKFILIPEKEGSLQIGPFTTNYFDPKTKTYKNLATDTVTLEIKPGDYSKKSIKKGEESSGEIANLSAGLRYLKPDLKELRSEGISYYKNPFFWIYPTSLIAILAFSWLRIKSGKPFSFRDKWEMLTPYKKMEKQLEASSLYAENGDTELFYENISGNIKNYLSNIFELPVYELSEEHLKNINPTIEEYISRLYRILRECDNARFSPGERKSDDMQKLLRETGEIVALIEEKL